MVAVLVDKDLHWRDIVAILIIGAVVSAYLIPALNIYLGLTPEMSNFIGFTIGFSARAVILQMKDRFAKKVADRIVDSI
jgi:hypothetical protein